jgi:hypothetical protein
MSDVLSSNYDEENNSEREYVVSKCSNSIWERAMNSTSEKEILDSSFLEDNYFWKKRELIIPRTSVK